MDRLLGLVGFVFVVSITPGPNNALLWASGLRFGFRRTTRHVAGTAVGMAALVLAMAAGIGVLLTEVPGAELALKVAGSAYLLYLAVRIATSHGGGRTVASRPLGVLHAAAFQFANPKAWLFAVIILGTATAGAAGGAALNRLVDGGPAQRAVSLALALVLAASVALIWT
jgi:threonine/homoserine/homoserine lactone efflux protein